MQTRWSESSQNTVRFLCLFLSFIGLALGLRTLFSVIPVLDMVNYQTGINPKPFPVWGCIPAGAIAFFGLSKHNRRKNLRRWTLAFLPFLLMIPTAFLLSGSFFSLPVTLLLFGWGVFRLASIYGGCLPDGLLTRKDTGQAFTDRFILLLYLAAAAWGFYMQYHAYRTFFLCYADWGIYSDRYLDLAFGQNVSWKNWLSAGDHWNPGVNLLMAGLIRLVPLPEFLFLLTSLLAYSAAPLAYFMGRKLGLNPFQALFFGIAAILNPVYSNLSLSLFYGFHPINFVIPLLLLFFLSKERKSLLGMGIAFALTLLVQETLMIFWFGYGLYLLLQRKWRPGLALCLFTSLGFVFLSSWVLPKLGSTNVYPLTYLFDSLGKTPLEIALSPFLKPTVFWAIFFQWQNIAFLLTLLVPFFFCIGLFPAMLITVVPLLAGVCVRPSPDVKNVVLWYGVEATTLILALSITNIRRILDGKRSIFPNLLNFGMKKTFPRRILAVSTLAATAVTVAGAYYCFGMTVRFGKYNYRRIAILPDGTSMIREIKKKLPEQCRILTTHRLRGHFLFEYPTVEFTLPRKTNDILILDLNDPSFDRPADLERIRREIAFDKRIVPLLTLPWEAKQFVVFRVTDTPKQAVQLPKMSFQEFEKQGLALPLKSEFFASRYHYADGIHQFRIQVRKTPKFDADFKALIWTASGKFQQEVTFGFGICPAYTALPGSVFTFNVKAPAPRKVTLNVTKRTGSDLPDDFLPAKTIRKSIGSLRK